MKIVFMGTPEFSVPALKNLIYSDLCEMVGVFSQPPRPAGRGKKIKKPPIHQIAEDHNIEVFTPKSLKSDDAKQQLFDLKPDFIIVAAYGLILPKEVIDFCPCINIHASILPRWRGAAPIHRAILAGDEISGISIMRMDYGLDTGDVLIEEQVAISDDDTTASLHDKLSDLGAKLTLEFLKNHQYITPLKQNDALATYAKKIEKHEAKLDFDQEGEIIIRAIRAFNPYPGAFILYNGEKITIFEAEFERTDKEGLNKEPSADGSRASIGATSDKGALNRYPSIIVDENFAISCKDGVIVPKIIQKQGKKRNNIADFLRGFQFRVGDVL